MNAPDQTTLESRVLVLAPTGKDATNSRAVLDKAGFVSALCRDIQELCREIPAGAGTVLLTEEGVAVDKASCLAEALRAQPAWSDLPLILLTRGGPESRAARHAMRTLGNVMLLERPVRVATLVTAVRAALRARARQYEIREHLAVLRDADRRKDEFLAMLAHELRNPLAPVRNALHIMRLPGVAADVVDRARDMTERQIGHMARLIDDLLEVSRVSRGKIQLKKEPLDLVALITRAVEVTQPVVHMRQHELTLSLPRHPVPLIADPARLEQVFVNLITNAAKYTPPGGQILVVAGCTEGIAVVRVRDTGVGIAPGLLPRIFDLFVQAEQGSDRSQGGLGIGLTLVKSLVEMHGGSVEARSEGTGAGSEFTVRLPGVGSDLSGNGHAATPPANVPPRRILVIDDSADAAESLSLLLQLQGHQVRTAPDGPHGLATAAAFHPEIVFLDIGLPGMDGYEVARRLRRHPDGRRVLLIALTGYGQEEDRQHARAAGFDHHLVKPANPAAVSLLLAERTTV